MTVIENGPLVRLPLVECHDPGLELAATPDGLGGGVRVEIEQFGDVGFEPGEEGLVHRDGGLDHLGQTCAKFAPGQSVEDGRVDEHGLGLVERPDEVFSRFEVDGGLASDRAVHAREHRGGKLDAADASHVGGGGKPRQVPHHSPAERDDGGVAVHVEGDKPVPEFFERGNGFRPLAGGDGEDAGGEAGGGEGAGHGGCVERPDVGIGDDGDETSGFEGLEDPSDMGQGSPFDIDGIGARAEGDMNLGHGSALLASGGSSGERRISNSYQRGRRSQGDSGQTTGETHGWASQP